MTDAADAAKLLPCPFCGASAAIIADERHRCFHIRCQGCSATMRVESDVYAVGFWNTRPQPAPPEGEPDLISAAEQFVDTFDLDYTTVEVVEMIKWLLVHLGLAARPKVGDAEVTQFIESLRYDHDPWKLDAADLLERLAAEHDELQRALSRAQVSGVERQAFDIICQERDGLETKLAEREAELALMTKRANDNLDRAIAAEQKLANAARQQRKVSAESDHTSQQAAKEKL